MPEKASAVEFTVVRWLHKNYLDMIASRIPEVYVLWHPSCQLGERLARRIHAWLRPGNGLGPQVFYRSLPAPEAPARGLPPALPGEMRSSGPGTASSRCSVSNLQIVLPLIDENLVADASWRFWLEGLAAPTPQRVMLPVALDATAYNMPPALRELNYLRPSGLPLACSDQATESPFEAAARSLMKQLTEAMCRLLLSRPRENEAAGNPASAFESPKVMIFLSHAKVDGSLPARRLRDYIYSQTQLAAFYDENDIAFGSAFSGVIQKNLDTQGAAAFIAVRSAQYASRPWCRRELSLFRKPRLEASAGNGSSNERWRLYPSLVVEAMDGRQLSGGIPEFGNSSLIRWSDAESDLEELVVTTVIRDAMLAAFHSAMGASIRSAPDRVIINWLPDPTTMLRLQSLRNARVSEVVHPGRGLSGSELDILDEFFPDITFRSFEEELT